MAKTEKKKKLRNRRRLVYGILWLVLTLLWIVLLISDVRWQVVRWLLLLHALCVLLSLVGMFQNLIHFMADNVQESPAVPAESAPAPEEPVCAEPEAVPAGEEAAKAPAE